MSSVANIMTKNPLIHLVFLLLLIVSPSVYSQPFIDASVTLPGVSSSSVAWGDYDNDGKLDILLTGGWWPNEGNAKIFHNNGDHTFTEKTGIALEGINSGYAKWGDYDSLFSCFKIKKR
jgi:hypothetical protein